MGKLLSETNFTSNGILSATIWLSIDKMEADYVPRSALFYDVATRNKQKKIGATNIYPLIGSKIAVQTEK